MSAEDTSGQAFPGMSRQGFPVQGMTLRQWFAGQALIAMGSKPADIVMAAIPALAKSTGRDAEWRAEILLAVSKSAYDIADAMIEAGNK